MPATTNFSFRVAWLLVVTAQLNPHSSRLLATKPTRATNPDCRDGTIDTAAGLLQLATPEVVIESCHGVTGEWCLLLQAHVSSPPILKEFIDRIYCVEGVQNTMTILSLTTYHEHSTTTRSTQRGA